jgi:putative ABC transport system permease protein
MGEAIWRDIRHGIRALGRAPGYTTATILTLGIALGGAAAVAALGESLLRPLPYPDPDRLVAVWEVREGNRSSVAPANYLDWRREATAFEALAAHDMRDATLTVDGIATRERVAVVSGNFFTMLGIVPAMGPGFDPDMDVTSGRRVAVLPHETWTARFGSDPEVIGRTVQVDDLAYEIVGVMPPRPSFPEPGLAVWVRSVTEAPEIRDFPGDVTQMRDAWYFSVVGRLAEGRDVASAGTELAAVAGRLAELYPETNAGSGTMLLPLLEQTVANFRTTLIVLALAVALVLLAAGVNVGHLALARAATRRGDMSVRSALGARRRDIARHLTLEGLLLGLGSALLGLGVAWLAVRAGTASLARLLPRTEEVAIRPAVVLLVLGLGGLGAISVSAVGFLHSTVKANARVRSNRSVVGGLTGQGLVAAQVAAAVTLLAAAGLLARSAARLSEVDLGFRESGLVTLRVAIPDARARAYPERVAEYRKLADAVARIPGVTAVGIGSATPLSMGPQANVAIVGSGSGEPGPNVGWQPVDRHYLRALGVPLLRGRGFTAADHADAENVGIVNETFVRVVFGGGRALGRQVTIGLDGHDRPITIVGVTSDTRTRGPADAPGPVLYRPLEQTLRNAASSALLVARTDGPADELLVSARSTLRSVAPGYPTYSGARGEDLARAHRASQSILFVVLGIFAVTALLLGLVGAYGVASYGVRRRRREIGVRMALGADRAVVLRQVVGRGLAPAVVGIPAGWLLSVLLGRTLESQLFGVSRSDPLTLGVVSALVLATTTAALITPARSAAGTDPAEALRQE